jgi:hypothetical protein
VTLATITARRLLALPRLAQNAGLHSGTILPLVRLKSGVDVTGWPLHAPLGGTVVVGEGVQLVRQPAVSVFYGQRGISALILCQPAWYQPPLGGLPLCASGLSVP